MPAVPQVFKSGPVTYTPAERINGGQLVEARGAGRIGVAAAASARVLGVALTDGVSPESVTTTPTTFDGRQVLNAALLPIRVAVAYGSDVVSGVTYDTAAAFGEPLVAAAGGRVRAFIPGGVTPDNPSLIVGRCAEPTGVVAGALGRVRLGI